MQLLRPRQLEEPSPCPYLPGRQKRCEYFLADGVAPAELSALLADGWRKFGPYYFRPACEGCRLCLPLRVPTTDFAPSRSQRRLLRRDASLRVEFAPLRFVPRIFELYRAHAAERFGQEADLEDFLFSFYSPSCPALQSEVYLGDELVAVGFLDRAADALSSVYFCYDPRHSGLGLGTFGALAEIEHARALGLPWYYLGYYVPGCGRMAYKDHFRPRQHLDRTTGAWREIAGKPGSSGGEWTDPAG
jgi:arginine-tRNA-protein transferase